MTRRRRTWPATRRELRAYNAGRRLAREHPDWQWITAELPAEFVAGLTREELEAFEELRHADWWRWFFDGWEARQRAEG